MGSNPILSAKNHISKKKEPTRPINSQEHRAKVIEGVKGVDYVYLDTSESRQEYLELLNRIKPSILAITQTNSNKTQYYKSNIWELKEFPDKNFPGFSTTEIIEKVLKKHTI